MSQDIVKQDAFLAKLSKITSKLGFAIMVDCVDSGIAVNINKGEITETTIPDNLIAFVKNEKEFYSYFNNEKNLVVLYFLRLTVDGKKYTLIIQDNKKRTRMNKLVSVLVDALDQPTADVLASAEQEGIIAFMEMRISELEKNIKSSEEELKARQNELEAQAKEVERLSSALEQQEQDAVVDMASIAQEKSELEQKAAELQAKLDEAVRADSQEAEVHELWGTAASEEVEELRKSLDDRTAELNKLSEEVEAGRIENAALQERMDALTAEIQVHKDIRTAKDEEIQSLQLDLKIIQEKEKLAELDESAIDGELADAKARIVTLESENSSLAAKLEQMRSETLSQYEINEQMKKFAALQIENETLKIKLEKADIELDELKNSVLGNADNNVSKPEHERIVLILSDENRKLKSDMEYFKVAGITVESYNKALEEIERWKKVRTKLLKEQDALKKVIDTLEEKNEKLEDAYNKLAQEVNTRNQDVYNKDKLISDLRQSMKEQIKQQNDLKRTTDSLADINEVLRKNRDKLNELINGLAQPIITVNNDYKIMMSNRATVAFTGAKEHLDVINKPCYYHMYSQSAPCAWCMLEKVRNSREPMQVNVLIGNEGNERHLDVTFFPIFDADHNVIEVAEFIMDKTEVVELAASVARFKEKMRDFKKSRIEDMNEITEVKRAYNELTAEHEKVVERNSKMLKVIERLVSEDKAKELLSVRTELMEVRNKLYRSSEMIKNYKYQLDEQLLKYSDLNKRTFLQMERLLNIMKNKDQLRSEETISVLTFLTREFDTVKKHFIEASHKNQIQALTEAKRAQESNGDTPRGKTAKAKRETETELVADGVKEFQSEEERILQEKLSEHKRLSSFAQNVLNNE